MNPFGAQALERYADCVVGAGVAVGTGDVVSIGSAIEHRELAVALAESAYRAGATAVEVRYEDRRVSAARIRYGSEASLGELVPWATARWNALVSPRAAVIGTIGESDPGAFDGLPPERVAAEHQKAAQLLNRYIDALLTGRVRWTGCAWPTAYWATQVYPDLDEERARKRLARDLL